MKYTSSELRKTDMALLRRIQRQQEKTQQQEREKEKFVLVM